MEKRLPQEIQLPPRTFGTEDSLTCRKDLYQLALLPFLFLVAWSCSDRLCNRLCHGLARLLYRLRTPSYEGYARIFRMLQSEPGDTPLAQLIPEAIALRHLERLQLLRYHRPGSWAPKVRLEGRAHLDRALSAGKGAILWRAHSPFSEVVSKAALHENGYTHWQLSRHTHGHFSSTRFGIHFLNPIRTAIEDRYLAGRVVIDPANSNTALFRVMKLLAQNQIVGITVWVEAGSVTMMPYGETLLAIPGGPAVLALKTGAALLPIFTERTPDGSFLVTIEEPLEAPAGGDPEERVAHVLCRQSALMEAYFRRLPSQFHYAYLHGATDRLRKQMEADRP